MTPLVREMVALAPGMAEQMHWFDASGLQSGHLVNLDSVNDNPLPYDHCAVCGFDGDAKWLVLLRQVETSWLSPAGACMPIGTKNTPCLPTADQRMACSCTD